MISLTLSMSLLAMALSAASAPIAAPNVSFGDLTTPSQGSTYSEFQASVPESSVSRRFDDDFPPTEGKEFINPNGDGWGWDGGDGGSFKRAEWRRDFCSDDQINYCGGPFNRNVADDAPLSRRSAEADRRSDAAFIDPNGDGLGYGGGDRHFNHAERKRDFDDSTFEEITGRPSPEVTTPPISVPKPVTKSL